MENKQNRSYKLLIYFILFAISGFSGLIYESIWTRYLKLFLGHAAYAQTLVLVIFMGGMALGAWLASRFTLKIKNLLIAYAIVEGVIGIFALIFHPIFTSIMDLAYSVVIPNTDSIFTVNLFKWAIGALFILPQCVLLGATFPLMSAGIIRRYPDNPGKSLAVLYFTNSFGAAVGVLVSSFLLVNKLGLPGTIIAAGIINLALAGIVAAISRQPVEAIKTEGDRTEEKPRLITGFLLIALLTGTASFIYEIGWIRMLSMVIGSTTHAFDIMLSAFILGIAIGGFAIRKSIDKLSNPVKSLAIIQMLMGAFAILTLLIYGGTLDFAAITKDLLDRTAAGFVWFNIYSYGVSILIMLPATICAGMTLPILTYYLLQKGHGEKSIGRIYSANTAGAILGVLLSYHVLMPLFGLKNMITIGGAIDIVLGVILIFYALPAEKRAIGYIAAAGSVAIVLLSFFTIELNSLRMATSLIAQKKQPIEKEVIFHKDGKTSTIDVIKIKGENPGALGMYTNGNPLGVLSLSPNAVINEHNAILLAAMPLSLHPKPRTAATFGLGTGLTSYVLASDPNIERLDIIEIEKAVVEGAKLFGEKTTQTLNDPRCQMHVEDAKTFFANRSRKYDIIVSDPTEPWVSGIADLYSKEFYKMISGHLTEEGYFVQWILSAGLDVPLVSSVMKAMAMNFKDYCIYNVNDNYLILIAGKNEIPAKPGERVFYYPKLQAELARIGILNTDDLYLHRLCGSETLDPLINSYNIPANSDYKPILESKSPKTHFMEKNANELLNLKLVPAPIVEVLEGQQPHSASEFNMLNADYTMFTYLPKQGKQILNYFKNADEYSNPDIFIRDDNTLNIVRYILDMHKNCGSDWIGNLRAMMQLTLPYLSIKEMDLIWKSLESSEKYERLSDKCRQWLDLCKNLSRRNYEVVLKLSGTLLPSGNIPANEDNNYLVTLHLLSQIALGFDKNEMRIFVDRYEYNDPPIHLRILKEYAD